MKVSVIILTYNHEKFIVQAVESVLNQATNFDYDIAIIEDFSPDKTREIVIDYQKKYPEKIRLFLPESNRNDNLEWMKAIDSAQGEYIALLDGDDYWSSTQKLQKQVDFLDSHPECAICFHSTRHFYEDGIREAYHTASPSQKEFLTIEDLYQGNFIPTCSVLFRRGLFGKFPDWFNQVYGGDWVVHILNAQYGQIGYINEVMGATRIHQGGAWNGVSNIKQLEVLINDYNLVKSKLEFMNNKIITSQLSKFYFDLALEYANQGDFSKSKTLAIKSIIERPINPYLSIRNRLKLLIGLYIPSLYKLMTSPANN